MSVNKKVLKYTSMKNETSLTKIHNKINEAKYTEPSEELRDLIFDIAVKHEDITIDQLQLKLAIDHGYFVDYSTIHPLLFSHPIAVETKKKIDAMDISCPRCGSDEKHYPLVINERTKIICFICGFEYSIKTKKK